jgi:hypothetical protein
MNEQSKNNRTRMVGQASIFWTVTRHDINLCRRLRPEAKIKACEFRGVRRTASTPQRRGMKQNAEIGLPVKPPD